MKAKFLLSVVMIGIFAVAALWLPWQGRADAATLTPVLQALPSTQGKTGRDYLQPQRPTLIKFWASWCPLCLAELQQTEQWASDSRFQHANLLTIASPAFLGEKKWADFQTWYAGLSYPKLPVLLDNGGKIARDLEIGVYPAWVVLDKHGKVQRIIKGSLNEQQALALIDNPRQMWVNYKPLFTNLKPNPFP